jgi:hypothetical protein
MEKIHHLLPRIHNRRLVETILLLAQVRIHLDEAVISLVQIQLQLQKPAMGSNS